MSLILIFTLFGGDLGGMHEQALSWYIRHGLLLDVIFLSCLSVHF